MFTIGIFSTHIPYVAFVFFYALFFLFSFQKVSSCEPEGNEKTISMEISFTSIVQQGLQDEPPNSTDYHFYTSFGRRETFNFDQKTHLLFLLTEEADSFFFCLAQFSRPPPAA
jgi:hypothetical protein